MSRDAFGNIMYGYLLEACGLSDQERLIGAGGQQVLDGSKWDWKPWIFDDPRDALRVMQGVDIYHRSRAAG